MTEYNPVETWRKSLSPADLDVHRGALFDSLRAAGKVSEKEVAGLSGGPDSLSKGDWLPGRQSVRLFWRENWDNESFWKKMNGYHNSPIDLANQIYERTGRAGIGTVTYTCAGVAAITGNIVCMGKMQDGKYITNPAQGAPRQFVDALTPPGYFDVFD